MNAVHVVETLADVMLFKVIAIATVFGSYDFINWKLAGKKAIEQNWALKAGFVGISTINIHDALVSSRRR